MLLNLRTHCACQLAFADGHTHDFTLFKESIGYSLPETIIAFVDLGYLGILNFHENTFIPAKNSKYHRLTEAEQQLNKEIAGIRSANYYPISHLASTILDSLEKNLSSNLFLPAIVAQDGEIV